MIPVQPEGGDPQFVVIKAEIIGSPEAWSTQYYWDGHAWSTRQRAIDHGWRTYDHDDFNVGTVQDGRLVAFGWGDDDFGLDSGYDLAEIAKQLGLKVSA